jgi:xylulokinase
MLCGLADGIDAVRAQGVAVRRLLLIGGAARSDAVRTVAGQLFGVPVVVPEPAEYVALGAARQAAWVLSGAGEPPTWSVGAQPVDAAADPAAGEQVRSRYAEVRDRANALLTAAAG